MNPVTKTQKITRVITDNVYTQNKLLEVLTHNLTSKEIDELFNKLKLCSKDLKN